MFKLIFLIRNFFKEIKVIRSINKLNKKLKTSFSYYLVLEEIDFLKAIDIEKDYPTMKRYEHFNNVSLLWLDGIKEEILYNYKNKKAIYHSKDEINEYFNIFKERLLNYLQFNKILSKTVYLNKTIEDDDIYLNSYIKFDLADIENYKDLLTYGLSTLSEIKKNYESYYDKYNSLVINKKNLSKAIVGVIKTKYKQQYYDFDDIIYFGPSTFNFYNKYIDLIKKSDKYYLYQDLNFKKPYRQKRRVYKRAKKERLKLFINNLNEYRMDQINGEINKINNFEKLIINNNYTDFYFDTFIWRLLNDLMYLPLKQKGGIKKVIDDIVNAKIKAISKYSPERTLEALMNIDDIDVIPLKDEPLFNDNAVGKRNMDHLIKEQRIMKELERTSKEIEIANDVPVLTRDKNHLRR